MARSAWVVLLMVVIVAANALALVTRTADAAPPLPLYKSSVNPNRDAKERRLGDGITLRQSVGTSPQECATPSEIEVTPGTAVTYCYTVTNQTELTLSMHTLTDTLHGTIFADQRTALAPGASLIYTRSDTILTTTINSATWQTMMPLAYEVVTSTCESFPDVSTTGTALNLSDDGTALVELPTAIPFYDIESNLLTVSNNGALLVGAPDGTIPAANTTLPTAAFQHAILPFWDDLDDDTGNVYIGTYTTTAQHPAVTWELPPSVEEQGVLTYYVVEWVNRPHAPGPTSSTATFAVALLLPGQGLDGYFYTCYADTVFGNPEWDNGASATVGINQYSTSAYQYSAFENRPELNDFTMLRYVPVHGSGLYSSTDTTTVTVAYADMETTPLSLTETHNPAPQLTYRTVTLSSTGNRPLDWTITEAASSCATPADLPWLALNQTSGTTNPSEQASVLAAFNSAGLPDDTYTGWLCIESNDYNSPRVEIPLTFIVKGSPITPTPTPTLTPTPTATPTMTPTPAGRLYLPLIQRGKG